MSNPLVNASTPSLMEEPLRRVYALRIRPAMIAKETGYTAAYISQLLKGRRPSQKARSAVAAAVTNLIGRQINVIDIWPSASTDTTSADPDP